MYFLFCLGSENNSLYLYYKGLSKTLLTFKFDTVKSVLDKDRKEDDTNEFVSAVCWRALPDGVRPGPEKKLMFHFKTTAYVYAFYIVLLPDLEDSDAACPYLY